MKRLLYIKILFIFFLITKNILAVGTIEISSSNKENPILFGYQKRCHLAVENIINKFGSLYIKSNFSKINPDLILNINLYFQNNYYICESTIQSNNQEYREAAGKITVKSKYIDIVPLLLVREIIILHTKIPIVINFEKLETDNKYEADIGHLTKNYNLYLSNQKAIEVLSVKSRTTLVESNRNPKNIKFKPQIKNIKHKYLNQINNDIEKLLIKYHKISKKVPEQYSEQKFLETLVITNPLGNLFAPGIGSYLSMSNIGIKNPEFSYTNIFLTFSVTAFQFLYVPYKNDYQFDLWPDEKSKYNENDRYLQKYLLITIPFTFSASFFDHLALNCRKKQILPPFFSNRDTAAAILSGFYPGGGFYYKGYRSLGLLSYSSHFLLGFFYFENYEENKDNKNYLYGLLALRAADILGSYFINTSYSFFDDEYKRKNHTDMYISLYPKNSNDIDFKLGLTKYF